MYFRNYLTIFTEFRSAWSLKLSIVFQPNWWKFFYRHWVDSGRLILCANAKACFHQSKHKTLRFSHIFFGNFFSPLLFSTFREQLFAIFLRFFSLAYISFCKLLLKKAGSFLDVQQKKKTKKHRVFPYFFPNYRCVWWGHRFLFRLHFNLSNSTIENDVKLSRCRNND